jgi:ABC-2 type transport system permease protein
MTIDDGGTPVKLVRDTLLLFVHNLTISLRNPMIIIIGLMQPITWLFLFAPLLNTLPLTPEAAAGDSINVFTPGMLMMLVPLGSMFAGIGLIAELRMGLIERMRVTPVNRLALVLGRALRDLLILLVQSIILIFVAWLMGLQANLIGLVASLGMMMLVGLLMVSCSYAMALALKNENAVASISNALLLPLILLSGVILPLTLAPRWLQMIAAFNPLAYAVDALRSLFQGNFTDLSVVYGFTMITVLAGLALFWAAQSFRRATA